MVNDRTTRPKPSKFGSFKRVIFNMGVKHRENVENSTEVERFREKKTYLLHLIVAEVFHTGHSTCQCFVSL